VSTGLSDYAERVPARGASVAPSDVLEAANAISAHPSVDEAVVMYILRLLMRVKPSLALTPVERAIVLGARAVFTELTAVCDALLTLPAAGAPAGAPAPAPAAPVPVPTPAPTEAPSGRARARQRPTPGGGSLQ
jgi:hypothetical protein